jgi:hypothetical protein
MSNIKREDNTIYELDPDGVNKWYLNVNPGYGLDGHRQPQSVIDKVVNKMAAVDELYEASEWLLNRVELLLAGTPVEDMDECISYSKKALLKARGVTQ